MNNKKSSPRRSSPSLPTDIWSHIIGFSDYKTAENLAHTSRDMRRLASPSRLAPQMIEITEEMIPYYLQHNLAESKHTIDLNLPAGVYAERGDLDMIKFLAQNNVIDHTIVDDVLSIAVEFGHLHIVQYLLDNGLGLEGEALIDAIKFDRLNIIQYLIEQRGIVIQDNPVALYIAGQFGRLDTIRYLAQHGANLRADDDLLLDVAATHGHLSIVRYLVEEHQVNVNTHEEVALGNAAFNGHLDIVQYLVEHGADVDALNGEVLLAAANGGHQDVFRYLLEHSQNDVLRRVFSIFLED